MRDIFTTGRLDKRLTTFIHRHPELNAATRSVMELIAKDPHASSLRAHRLKGNAGRVLRISALSRVPHRRYL